MDTHRPVMEPLLTVEQVAGYLHLSRTTVYRLVWSRSLRTVTVGSRIRVPESAVAEYVAKGPRP